MEITKLLLWKLGIPGVLFVLRAWVVDRQKLGNVQDGKTSSSSTGELRDFEVPKVIAFAYVLHLCHKLRPRPQSCLCRLTHYPYQCEFVC